MKVFGEQYKLNNCRQCIIRNDSAEGNIIAMSNHRTVEESEAWADGFVKGYNLRDMEVDSHSANSLAIDLKFLAKLNEFAEWAKNTTGKNTCVDLSFWRTDDNNNFLQYRIYVKEIIESFNNIEEFEKALPELKAQIEAFKKET